LGEEWFTQERQITTLYTSKRHGAMTNKRNHVDSFCHIRQILFSLTVSKKYVQRINQVQV